MMRNTVLTIGLCGLMLSPALSEKTRADNLSSPWIIDQYTKSRLFVGGYDKENRILRLGWHLSLKDGWKTYWRTPGDAGLPPQWIWKETRNVRAITVNWPRPERLHIFGMDTHVYQYEVILPVDVEISDAGKAVAIDLDLQYLICADICIPQEGRYRLDVSALENIKVSLFQKAQLDRYRDQVPVKISGKDFTAEPDPDQENMLIIHLPDDFKNVEDIIVEGPDGILFAEVTSKGKNRYNTLHNSKQPLTGQALTLTLLLKGGGAREAKVTVRP